MDTSQQHNQGRFQDPISPPERRCVLIRGLVRSRFHWHEFPGLLLRQNTISDVVLPELAGNGERFNETTPFGIRAMMEDIRQHSRRLLPEPTPPVVLVAISMGGMIATEWARCYPQEVQEIHLINTSFGALSPPWQRIRPAALLPLLRHFHTIPQRERTIAQHTLSTPIDSARLQQWIEFANRYPISLSNTLTQILSASRYRGMKVPPIKHAVVYASRNDHLVSSRCSERIAQTWQVPAKYHDHAGHDLPLDDPEWLVQQIVHHQLKTP